MANATLLVRRINNGQSEIWLENQPDAKRTVATNGILYPIRTTCSKEEVVAFQQALDGGTASVPSALTVRLASEFELS
jgi:hypothetical protein